MKIVRISVYQVDLPLVEGRYSWSGGNTVTVFDSTVVRVETDEGIVGWGENCPLGPAYLPAYAKGTREGVRELAPVLLGQDPTELLKINLLMDAAMKGHPYVKAPIDMACWDILGKVTKQPICHLMGGRFGERYPLYRAISQDNPDVMAESIRKYRREGYRKFQLKVGGKPDDDIARILACRSACEKGDVLMADANTGWLMHEAVRVIQGVQAVDVYIEQPCDSYEENLSVRRMCSKPFILDESITDIKALLRAVSDSGTDVINLKISKVGGLTRARQLRDLCVSLGIAMNIEDTWGGDIVTAAISHLAHSTPPRLLFASTDFNSYVTKKIADYAPRRADGFLSAPTQAGLGVEPILAELGEPVFECTSNSLSLSKKE